MANIKKKNLVGTMSSISALQGTCNRIENDLTRKLISLEAAVDTSGVKVTEAAFERVAIQFETGKLKIEEFTQARKDAAEFEGDAFIQSVRTKVLVFRGD